MVEVITIGSNAHSGNLLDRPSHNEKFNMIPWPEVVDPWSRYKNRLSEISTTTKQWHLSDLQVSQIEWFPLPTFPANTGK